MKVLPDNQCRRCGRQHDDVLQWVDPEGCWAVSTVHCDCGHTWTMIYTAPMNLRLVRSWLVRGCDPAEGPVAIVRSTPWQPHRLEGVAPTLVSEAS